MVTPVADGGLRPPERAAPEPDGRRPLPNALRAGPRASGSAGTNDRPLTGAGGRFRFIGIKSRTEMDPAHPRRVDAGSANPMRSRATAVAAAERSSGDAVARGPSTSGRPGRLAR